MHMGKGGGGGEGSTWAGFGPVKGQVTLNIGEI